VADPAIKQDRVYTYSDYRSWPDDERWELIEGTAWNMSAAPMRLHQGISGELFLQIGRDRDDGIVAEGVGQTNGCDMMKYGSHLERWGILYWHRSIRQTA